jgi:hypothetical protein
MKGGWIIETLVNNESVVNLRYKKGKYLPDTTGDFSLSNVSNETYIPIPRDPALPRDTALPRDPALPNNPELNCFDSRYNITFILIRKTDKKQFKISFKVVYTRKDGNKLIPTIQRELIISTLKPKSQEEYEEFCTVTKKEDKKKKLKISTGEIGAISNLKLVSDGDGDGDEVYTFPVSSTRNKNFFVSLVKYIAKYFDVCEPNQEIAPRNTYDRYWDVDNINTPRDAENYKYAYLGTQDPVHKKMMDERTTTQTNSNSVSASNNDTSQLTVSV